MNKYYTADVHFETRLAQEFKSSHAKGVPAIIYVWQQGDVSVSSLARFHM